MSHLRTNILRMLLKLLQDVLMAQHIVHRECVSGDNKRLMDISRLKKFDGAQS